MRPDSLHQLFHNKSRLEQIEPVNSWTDLVHRRNLLLCIFNSSTIKVSFCSNYGCQWFFQNKKSRWEGFLWMIPRTAAEVEFPLIRLGSHVDFLQIARLDHLEHRQGPFHRAAQFGSRNTLVFARKVLTQEGAFPQCICPPISTFFGWAISLVHLTIHMVSTEAITPQIAL